MLRKSPNFCKLKFGVTFPLMAKIDVNGDEAPRRCTSG